MPLTVAQANGQQARSIVFGFAPVRRAMHGLQTESGSAEPPALHEPHVIENCVVCAPGEHICTYIRQTPEIVQSGRRRGLGKGTIIAEVMDGDIVGRWGHKQADGSVVPVTSGVRTFDIFQGVCDGWIKTDTLSKLSDYPGTVDGPDGDGPLAIQDRDRVDLPEDDGPLAIQDRDHAGADGDAVAAPRASAAAARAGDKRAPPKPELPPESVARRQRQGDASASHVERAA